MTVAEHLFSTTLPLSFYGLHGGKSEPRADTSSSALPSDPYARLTTLYPQYVTAPFADHHRAFWNWLQALEPGVRPDPFAAIWARGGAKSSSIEMGVADAGAQKKRKYCLYVSGTKDQADDHVTSIAGILESPEIAKHYPQMAERSVGKFGNPKGWRRNRLWTASGFVVDALGLDVAIRGVKLEDQRPDLIVLDDIDSEDDSPQTTANKIRAITKKLLPAGSADVAIVAVQNLVIPDGVFAQLADGRADWLARRIVSGPIPAIENLTYVTENGKHRITGGTPTWEGQNLATCQAQLDDWGLDAFLTEAQHEVLIGGDLLVYGVQPNGIKYYDPARNRVPAKWRLEQSKWQIGMVDPGGGGVFKSGIGVLGVSGDERMHFFREGLLPSSLTARMCAEWFTEIGAELDAVVYDPSQESLGEALRELGYAAYPANNARQYGVGIVREHLLSVRLTLDPEATELHKQMGQYWRIKPGENVTAAAGSFPTRAGPGHHAELPDLLRYGVVFVQEHFPRNRVGQPGSRVRVNTGQAKAKVMVR